MYSCQNTDGNKITKFFLESQNILQIKMYVTFFTFYMQIYLYKI